MKKLSKKLLSDAVRSGRNRLSLSQAELSRMTGINRSILSNLENGQYMPSIEQLEELSSVLGFQIPDLLEDDSAAERIPVERSYRIAVAGVGYVGLSLAVLLSVTGGSLSGAEAVAKSLPDFFDRLSRLGIKMTFEGSGNHTDF